MTRPGKIVCVGRNYTAHARELGHTVPEQPLIFFKPPSAVIGQGQPIVLPAASRRVEHEGEIGVIVGSNIKDASEDQARAAIAGIACVNDVTARDLQRTDKQWTRAKGFDTFCPVGEVYPLASDFDLASLQVLCRVNGEMRQHGRTADMVFSIPFLLSYISRIMTLERGDLIATGTPEGVGQLMPGDVVQVEIPGHGALQNPVMGHDSRDWSD